MLKLIIEDDEGRKTVVPFVRDEITIGRQEGNTIRLTERNVSRRHARLLRVNGHVLVEDLGSYNGIRLNGERIQGKSEVRDGDLIQIGDYDLAIQSGEQVLEADPVTDMGAPPPPPGELVSKTDIIVTVPEFVSGENLTEVSADMLEPSLLDSDPPRRVSPPAPAAPAPSAPTEGSLAPVGVEDIPAEEAPRLVVLNTEFAGREFACIHTELRVGRADDNDIAVDHRSLSPTHARIFRQADGSWRVSDTESSNGLNVNGEPYSQAELRPGDVLELGHVRFKFVGAGQTFRFVPGQESSPSSASGGRSARWLAVTLGVLVLLTGGYVGFREQQTPGFAQGLWAQARSVIGGTQAPPSDSAQALQPPMPGATEPPGLQHTLDAASDAIAARDMEKAAALLGSVLGNPLLRPERRTEVAELLERARSELAAKNSLTQARDQLKVGNLEESQKLLALAEGTHAFARELEEVRTDLQTALTAQRPAPKKAAVSPVAAAVPAPKPAQKPLPKPLPAPRRAPAEEADRLFRDGTDLFVKKQLPEAMGMYTRCLEVDPTFARCHMMLGSTYARLGQAERGAQHYRTFITLAPNDGEAAKVRILLEEYEKTKRRQVAPSPTP